MAGSAASLGEVALAVAIAAIVLCLLTAVFDTVMIAAGLFRYDPSGTLRGIALAAPRSRTSPTRWRAALGAAGRLGAATRRARGCRRWLTQQGLAFAALLLASRP